jgi:hypothetical protein
MRYGRNVRVYERRGLTVDGEAMGQTHEKFVEFKRDGRLLSPEVVGKAIAGMAVVKSSELRGRSGEFVQWDDKSIAELYKHN